MILPRKFLGLMPHEVATFEKMSRRPVTDVTASHIGALTAPVNPGSPVRGELIQDPLQSLASVGTSRGLLRPGPGVPPEMTYRGIIEAKQQI